MKATFSPAAPPRVTRSGSGVCEADARPTATIDVATVVAAFAGLENVGTPSRATPHAARLVVIDDEPTNLRLAGAYLRRDGYPRVFTYDDPHAALAALLIDPPDLVLTDIAMPGLSGLELLRRMRSDARLAAVPVICLSASIDAATKREALDLGATDFLGKPFDPEEMLPRVRNALLLKSYQDDLRTRAATLEGEIRARTAELEESRREVIHCLARAAEFRDNETGRHVVRVGKFAAILAKEIGCGDRACELIELAAPLHDIGKIGIPDAILLKPGKLTADEFSAMQRHAEMGEQIVSPGGEDDWANRIGSLTRRLAPAAVVDSPVLAMAARIAATHHERWDGTGYPHGLAGAAIPLEGRITAVADVFDALSSARPYKPAFPLHKSLVILNEGRGTHFDPQVLDAFLARLDDILAVQRELAD